MSIASGSGVVSFPDSAAIVNYQKQRIAELDILRAPSGSTSGMNLPASPEAVPVPTGRSAEPARACQALVGTRDLEEGKLESPFLLSLLLFCFLATVVRPLGLVFFNFSFYLII